MFTTKTARQTGIPAHRPEGVRAQHVPASACQAQGVANHGFIRPNGAIWVLEGQML